jgi:hypothetical protein
MGEERTRRSLSRDEDVAFGALMNCPELLGSRCEALLARASMSS